MDNEYASMVFTYRLRYIDILKSRFNSLRISRYD